jgi:hypothetical protein
MSPIMAGLSTLDATEIPIRARETISSSVLGDKAANRIATINIVFIVRG